MAAIPMIEEVLDRLDRLETLSQRQSKDTDDLRIRLREIARGIVSRESVETDGSATTQRIAALEKTVIEQAAIITTLTERAIQSDVNFQRLIAAVEKLCEVRSGEAAQPVPTQHKPLTDLPFERQFSEAMESAAKQPDTGFRPRIVPEEEKPRHRKPMARI